VDIEIDDFDWELNGQLVACTEIARLVLKPGESTAALSGSNAIELIIAPVGRSDADHSTETDTIWGMMNFVCHARGYKPGTDTVLCTGSGMGTLTMLKGSKTGWKQISGKWYYFGTNGKMQKNSWVRSGSDWCYVSSDGVMVTGWLTLSGNTYWFDSSGRMATGWRQVKGKYYYFMSSGVMARNKWVGDYWLKDDGTMAVNEWVDGGKYYVGFNGAWVKGKTR
jgi:YHS domain-containing protein